MLYEMEDELEKYVAPERSHESGGSDAEAEDGDTKDVIKRMGGPKPDAVRIKLKWLTFAKVFNIRRRIAHDSKQAFFSLVKGLEFMKQAACSPASVLMTLETYLIAHCLLNAFVIEGRALLTSNEGNQRYIVREMKEVIKAIRIQAQEVQEEEIRSLRLELHSYDQPEENKYLSKKAVEDRSKHRRDEQLLLPVIINMVQDIEDELKSLIGFTMSFESNQSSLNTRCVSDLDQSEDHPTR